MNELLQNKVAIVTGSGQGVGRAIAISMAKEGAKVITNNRKPGTMGGDAKTVAEEIINMGREAMPFFGDVADFSTAERLVRTAVKHFGGVDILVNNAGTVAKGPIWTLTQAEFDEVLDSNLRGTFNCTRFASEVMKEQRWGRILNCISSCWLGAPDRSHYGAAKAGIVGFTRCAAVDMAKHNVTCNAYLPYARSRLSDRPASSEAFKKRLELGLITREEYEWQMNPPSAEELTPFIIYLCTDAASGVNGKVFYASGGKVAIYSEPVRRETIAKEGQWTIEELIEKVPSILTEK